MTQISQMIRIDYSLCQAHLSKCALLFPKCGLHILKSKSHLSFPDFSRRFFVSLAKKVYTFLLAILEMFTLHR